MQTAFFDQLAGLSRTVVQCTLMGHGPGVSQRRQEHMLLSTELRTDNLMGEVMTDGVLFAKKITVLLLP